MKFLVDENLPAAAADVLRKEGHDAITVHDRQLVGADDTQVAALAQAEQRALITLDVDFGNTQLFPPANYFGLIVMRLADQSWPSVFRALGIVLMTVRREPLVGQLWVVEENRVRFR